MQLTGFTLSDPELTFLAGGNDVTVNPGESHVVSIRLTPVSTNALHAFLTFNSNVSGHLNVSIPVYANDSVFDNVDELTENSITISPVPAGDLVTVKSFPGELNGISIYDIAGRKLVENKTVISSSELVTDVSTLSPGVYLIGIEMKQKMFFKKIVKE